MKDLAGMRRATRAWILDEGVEVAVATALEICRDGHASYEARAACADVLLRAAGMYHRDNDDGESDVTDPFEDMTSEELHEEMRRLEASMGISENGAAAGA